MLSVTTNTETPENLRYCWYSIFYASDMVEGGINMWEKWMLSFMDGPVLLSFPWAFLKKIASNWLWHLVPKLCNYIALPCTQRV